MQSGNAWYRVISQIVINTASADDGYSYSVDPASELTNAQFNALVDSYKPAPLVTGVRTTTRAAVRYEYDADTGLSVRITPPPTTRAAPVSAPAYIAEANAMVAGQRFDSHQAAQASGLTRPPGTAFHTDSWTGEVTLVVTDPLAYGEWRRKLHNEWLRKRGETSLALASGDWMTEDQYHAGNWHLPHGLIIVPDPYRGGFFVKEDPNLLIRDGGTASAEDIEKHNKAKEYFERHGKTFTGSAALLQEAIETGKSVQQLVDEKRAAEKAAEDEARKVRDLQRLLTPEDFEAFEAPEGVDIDSLSQSELYRLVLDQKKEREAIALAAEADARAAQELQEQQQADRLAYLKEFLSDEDIALARASIDAMGDNFGQEDEIALLERAAAIKNEAAERQHERQVAEYNEWAESYISASDRAKLEGLSGAARQSALDAAVKRRQATEAASAQRLAEAQAQQAADGFDSNEQTGNDLGGRETSDAAAWINFAKEAQERFPNADDPVAELAKEIEREGARQRIITANEQAAIDNQLAELARVAEQQNPGSDDPLQELVKTVEREDSRQRIIAANIAREAQEKYPDADDPAAELAKEIERDQSRQQIFADRFAREAARQFPDADDPTAERIKKIEQDLKRHVVLQDNQAAAIRASDLEAEQEQVGNDLGDRATRAANSIAEAHLMYEKRTLPSMEAERTADNARKAEADERAKAMGLGPEFGIGAAKDVGREVLSLGQVETKTFDPGAAIIALEDAGEAVTPENIQRVRDLEASLKELAIATGKSQIPLHDAIVAARAGNYGEAGANVALDVFSFVPIFGQMAKAARAGATAGRVAGIGARGLVPIGNPQGLGRTVKGYRDLVETAVNPNVIPISALESRRTTIRVPLEEYGDITEAQAQQIRDMQARMRIESGQPVAVQRPDGKFLEVRGTATRGQLDGTAFHTTPGGGSFDRPAYIYGQEGGLYTAPDVHMRFGDATSRGQVLPQQSEIIAVRDPDQIQNLQGSDKTFMGNLEQELIIPSGQSIRVDNPASNLRTFDSSVGDIKTGRYGRIEADTDRIPIKTIGGDISLADRMRLKATGARNVFETLNPIGYYDRQRGWRVLDRPSDDAIRLNPADRPPDGTPPRITDDIDDYADDAARRRRVENIQREADGGGYVASGGRELSRSDDEPSIDQRRGVEPVSDEGTAVVRRGVDRVSDEAEALRRAQQRQDEIRRIVGRSQEQRRRDAAERPRRQRSARQPGRQTPERVTRTTPERITRTTPERVTRTTPTTPRTPVTTPTTPKVPVTTPTTPRVPFTTPTTPPVTVSIPPTITLPPFEMPSGLRLRRGEYPREVEWLEGDLRYTQDLITGNRQVRFANQPSRLKPEDTFRVIATSREVPSVQRIDLGETDVYISQQGLRFAPSETLEHPRERRRGDRPFGRRRGGRF